jgi:hypothetical protein
MERPRDLPRFVGEHVGERRSVGIVRRLVEEGRVRDVVLDLLQIVDAAGQWASTAISVLVGTRPRARVKWWGLVG